MILRDLDKALADAKSADEFDDILDKQYADFIRRDGKPESDELYVYYANRAGYLAGRLKMLLWQVGVYEDMYDEEK